MKMINILNIWKLDSFASFFIFDNKMRVLDHFPLLVSNRPFLHSQTKYNVVCNHFLSLNEKKVFDLILFRFNGLVCIASSGPRT